MMITQNDLTIHLIENKGIVSKEILDYLFSEAQKFPSDPSGEIRLYEDRVIMTDYYSSSLNIEKTGIYLSHAGRVTQDSIKDFLYQHFLDQTGLKDAYFYLSEPDFMLALTKYYEEVTS